mmetsp:Transcript_10875/g.38156  ORF Transcript_10875/g.38156 Transcript_10875/m.38156 type:complete len:120 (-) Transcript_10875:440-799(-)
MVADAYIKIGQSLTSRTALSSITVDLYDEIGTEEYSLQSTAKSEVGHCRTQPEHLAGRFFYRLLLCYLIAVKWDGDLKFGETCPATNKTSDKQQTQVDGQSFFREGQGQEAAGARERAP